MNCNRHVSRAGLVPDILLRSTFLQSGKRRGDAGRLRAAVRDPSSDVIHKHAVLRTAAIARRALFRENL